MFRASTMPEDEYEKLIDGIKQVPVKSASDNHREMTDTLWSTNSSVNLLFDSIGEPAAVYEFEMDSYKALRVNSKFIECFGYGQAISGDPSKGFTDKVSKESMQMIIGKFNEVAENESEGHCTYMRKFLNGEEKKVDLYLRYWGRNETSSVIFAMFKGITKD